jgi:nucleoid-associated protein YgaU
VPLGVVGMGKDYRIGLICGLVAAVASVIWLATRPSLNGRAQTPGPAVASAEKKPVPAPKAVEPLDQSIRSTAPAKPPRTQSTPETPRSEPPRTEPVRTADPSPVASKPVPPPAAAAPATPAKTHIVQNGETLSSIAQQYYGNSGAWQRIYNANTKVIKNPNVVPPGTKLTIP